MKNDYPFHINYTRALTSGNVSALRKLIRHALNAKPQKIFFTGDETGEPLTRFEELTTAVWRTFEGGQVAHGSLFLNAGLPVDILLPDVEGITTQVFWTPLDITIMMCDDANGGQLKLTQMLLAAGANPKRQIWNDGLSDQSTPFYVRTLAVARAFWEYGVPAEAFVCLPPHLRARL
jgi:hypothetical protein